MLVVTSNSRIKPQDDLYAELSELDDKLSRSCGLGQNFASSQVTRSSGAETISTQYFIHMTIPAVSYLSVVHFLS